MSIVPLIKQLLVGPLAVCCYLVGCPETKEAVIIDPGGDEDIIVNALEEMELIPKLIVNTHAHPDHTGANRALKQILNIPIAMHEADAGSFLRQANLLLGSMFGITPSPEPDILLKDGDKIEFGQLSLKVIHTPGHTPGSICLYYPGHVFTGDTLFVGAVGRTDLPGGDWRTLVKSIKTKLFTLSDDTIVWPGHHYGSKPTSTIKEEKLFNPYVKQG
jgi:glyoxylase-like metal-dependent hydrolase (beta-lactamase superfamily II)